MKNLSREQFEEIYPMPDPAMLILGDTRGHVIISHPTLVSGKLRGSLVVRNGAYLVLRGALTGLLQVEKGGTAMALGTIRGKVLVDSGNFAIFGKVQGDILVTSDSVISVSGPVTGKTLETDNLELPA